MEYFEGAPYRINIEGGDSTLVLDSYTRALKANVVDQNDNIVVDYETGTFFGTLVGNIVSEDNNVILNLEYSTLTIEKITGSLIALNGSISYDHETQTFNGQFNGPVAGPLTGDVLGSNNALLVDYTNNLIVCDVRSNILNNDNTVAFDGETNTFQGNFVGNFLDLEGNVILSSERISINEVNTDLIADDETVAFDKETGTFTGTLTGSIFDEDGYILVDSENRQFHGSVYFNDATVAIDAAMNTFHGTLLGDIINEDGSIVLDTGTSTLEVDTIIAKNITGNLAGTFTGEIIGNINNSNIITDDIVTSKIAINTSSSYEDNDGPLDIFAFHNKEASTSISLARGKGTLENPGNLNPGDKLVSIMLSGITGSHNTTDGYIPEAAIVAGFEASVDETGVVQNGLLPGKLTAWVFDSNDDAHAGWVIDHNGDFTATIKDLTVKGETGNAPASTGAPTKWLEMSVNGETVYMPLYT